MADNTPEFGSLPDRDEFNRLMEDFNEETFWFTDDTRKRANHVNILHLSTDLDGVAHQTGQIVTFMTENGFAHMPATDTKSWSDVDMIMLGSDAARKEAAYNILWYNSFGLSGLVPYWDMLWYGTDYIPQFELTPSTGQNNPLILTNKCRNTPDPL